MKTSFKRTGEILSKFDFLGNKFEFTHQGRGNHSTWLGGLLSILVIATTTFFVIVFFSKWYDTSSPMITEVREFVAEYPENNLYDMKYFSYYTLFYQNQPVPPEEIPRFLRIGLSSYKVRMDENFQFYNESRDFNYVACSEPWISGFYSNLEETNISKRIFDNYSICLNFTRSDREFLAVKGRVIDEQFSSIAIKISPCQPGDGIECMPADTLPSCYLIRANIRYSFDPSNFNTPIKRISTFEDKLTIDPSRITDTRNNIGLVEIYDNRYDMIGDSLKESYLEVVKSNTFTFDKYDESPYAIIQFFSSGSIRKIYREYVMLLDTLGNIGGVFDIFMFIALTLYWCKDSMYKTFMREELFNQDLEDISRFFPSMKRNEMVGLIDDMIENRKDANQFMSDLNQLELLLKAILKPQHRALIPLVLLKEEEKKNNLLVQQQNPIQILFKGIMTSLEKMNYASAYNLTQQELDSDSCSEAQCLIDKYLLRRLKDSMVQKQIINHANKDSIEALNVFDRSENEIINNEIENQNRQIMKNRRKQSRK